MDPAKNETVSPTTELNNRRSLPASLSDEFLFLRVSVPDLNIQKCFQFNRNQNIGDIKEQCVASLPLELKQSFNYGLFCPPTGTKCGKFLDENKALSEYPFSDYVGYLELRFKQRIYKSSKMDEKQFKAVNTRTNLRRFVDYIQNGQIEKVTKMCNKGLDPNFHCVDTGETPLTLACTLADPSKMLLALIEGGALLDFRDLSGSTPLHRAVESNNIEAVITLLELGSSPNCKDTRGLTPLYLSISRKTDVSICEILLHNKATIGAQDVQGWQEIHQACRYGLFQHLEHLLFYGADINAKNASGNTPLHVCAVNGQESCAKLLLHKGAQNDALNFANQSPYQVAVIAGNLDLASIIQNFRTSDAEKSIGDCSDVISNNSSGIGTANSDFTESNFSIKANDTANSSGSSSGIAGDTLSPVGLKARNRFSCCEPSSSDPLILPVYRPSQNLKERMANCNKYYATAPRQKHQLPAEPRTVVLHKTKRGFGFILRGAKATSSLMDVKATGVCPALQYLDDVDKGSVADLAGLRKGDYLLAINGEDVSSASHEKVVELIRSSGKLVTMTVVSRSPANVQATYDTKLNDWQTSAPLGYATLPNKLRKHRSTSAGHIVAPLPPRRDPKTTLSVGKANSRNIFTKPGRWESEDKSQTDGVSKETQPKTASIRSRPISSRITTAELEELFQRQAELSPIYQDHQFRYDEHSTNGKVVEKTELRRNFYSVPDLVQITICNNKAGEPLSNSLRNHKSQDNVNESDGQSADGTSSTSSMKSYSSAVKVKSKNKSSPLYASNVPPSRTTTIGVNSSFNPNNNAVIYACPSDLGGYKENQNGSATVNRNQIRKSASIHSHSSLRQSRCVAGASATTANHYSNGSAVVGVAPVVGAGAVGARYKNVHSNRNSYCFSPPPIPDPDYSQSDEESEQQQQQQQQLQQQAMKNCAYKTNTLPLANSRNKMAANKVTVVRGAGADALNGGVGAVVQSFNVEEIRKARSLLRSSTPFSPGYTTLLQSHGSAAEDGDNSSSGVSSDQEISSSAATAPLNGVDQSSTSPPLSGACRGAAAAYLQLPALGADDSTSAMCGIEPKGGADLVVLPPPEFVGGVLTAAAVDVLEPPPQFSDDHACK